MKKWLIHGLLLSGGLLVALVCCEIVLRLTGFSDPLLYDFDPIVGFRPLPGAEGWNRDEGETYIVMNSDGLRDREHQKIKPPRTYRIAILGDSYAEARQIPIEQTFWSVLERRLNRCEAFHDGQEVEVINFGVTGHGTAREYLTLKHYAWQYSPDMVILAFLTGNDIQNNSKVLEGKLTRPYFLLKDGELSLDKSFADSPEFKKWKEHWFWKGKLWVRRHSRLYQFARKVLQYGNPLTQEDQRIVEGEEVGLDSQVYKKPQTPEWKEAWKITEKLLVKIRDEVQHHQARFLVVTLCNAIQVQPDPAVRQRFMKQLAIDTLFYPDLRIQAFAKQQDIEVLTLAPQFQRYAEQHMVFLHGFPNTRMGTGHWNSTGHRLAGKILAEYLCANP